jgi:hypothetical protein
VQTVADQVKRTIAALGEPAPAAEAAALEATMLAALRHGSSSTLVSSQRRPGRPMRVLAIAALILLISVVAAVAAGIGDLFGGPPAPAGVKRALSAENAGQLPWASPRIVAAKARRLMRVSTPHGALTLWIAPTRDGNLCLALQHPQQRSLGAACIRRERSAATINYAVDDAYGESAPWFRSIWGRAPKATKSLELVLADQTTRNIRLVHGFFIAPIGRLVPTLLVARDASGRVIARQHVLSNYPTPHYPTKTRRDGSPAFTLIRGRQVLVHALTWAGELRLSKAPSIYGGPCEWITLGNKPSGWFCQGALATANPANFGFELNGAHGRPIAVFFGYLPPARVAAIRFNFADGHNVRLRAGWVLYPFPPISALPAHRPIFYDFLARDGHALSHHVIHADEAGMFNQALTRSNAKQLRTEIQRWTRLHPGYKPTA